MVPSFMKEVGTNKAGRPSEITPMKTGVYRQVGLQSPLPVGRSEPESRARRRRTPRHEYVYVSLETLRTVKGAGQLVEIGESVAEARTVPEKSFESAGEGLTVTERAFLRIECR